ncbi:MAG: hypothetical protein VZR64_11905 [Eubacterium sp.]|nr:hypothetical protein [Eubacterium sp.]
MINPVDRLSWQEMLGHPASAGHLVDTQVNTAYNKMAALSDHIDEFKDLYDFIFRIKGWLRYYLQTNYGLRDVSESGLSNDTNGIGGDIDLFNPAGGSGSGISAEGEIITKKVWRIYIKNYDEMVRASYEGLPVPNPIVRFANIYDPSKPSYLDLSYDDNGNPTFSGTFNAKDPNSFIPLRYLNEQIAILRRDLAKVVSVDRSISTTTDSHGRANKRLVVNDVINFSDGSHINASGAADVPFMTKGSKVTLVGEVSGSATVDDDGNVTIGTSGGGNDCYNNSNKNISTSIQGSGNNSMTIKDTYHRKNGQDVVNSQTVTLPFATYQEMVDYVNGHKGSDIGSADIVAAYWSDTATISGTDVMKKGEVGKVYPASQIWLHASVSGTTTTLKDHPAGGNYRCLSTSYAKNNSGENSSTTSTGSSGDRWFIFDGTLGTFMKVS